MAQSIGVTITNTQNTSYYAWNSGGSGGQSANPLSGSIFTGESYQVARADIDVWPRKGGGFDYNATDDQGSKQLQGTFNTGTSINIT